MSEFGAFGQNGNSASPPSILAARSPPSATSLTRTLEREITALLPSQAAVAASSLLCTVNFRRLKSLSCHLKEIALAFCQRFRAIYVASLDEPEEEEAR
jgi:hypothetical protein